MGYYVVQFSNFRAYQANSKKEAEDLAYFDIEIPNRKSGSYSATEIKTPNFCEDEEFIENSKSVKNSEEYQDFLLTGQYKIN